MAHALMHRAASAHHVAGPASGRGLGKSGKTGTGQKAGKKNGLEN